MRHPLTDNYAAERATLIELGRTLSESEGARMSTACPAWSIKDIYAHLAGIATDILTGNVEGAATEPWADAQVAARSEHTLHDVLREWETAGAEVSAVMGAAGAAFPFKLFLDQWTHGWDIRAAIGPAAATTPDTTVWTHFHDDCVDALLEAAPEDLGQLTLALGEQVVSLGSGPSVGEMSIDPFEFGRIQMGRRSRSQLEALPWPEAIVDPQPYIDVFVFWSVSEHDITDPTRVS